MVALPDNISALAFSPDGLTLAVAHGNTVSRMPLLDLNSPPVVTELAEAATALQRALEIQPSSGSAGVYTNLGTARFFQGRYQEAVAAFEKAVELNPTWYLYWGNLADGYRWIQGNEQKAKAADVRALKLHK